MTGYLLDTNIALIGLAAPKRLRRAVLAAIEMGPNLLSSVTYWEVMLKCMKGKLDVGDPRIWWLDALDQLAATALPLRPDHVARLYDLDPVHPDPFDRILIAQAMVENLTFVTTEGQVLKYASKGNFRVVC